MADPFRLISALVAVAHAMDFRPILTSLGQFQTNLSKGSNRLRGKMQPISNQALRDYFIGWQCRLRQMAMRDYGGQPLPGMQPRVTARSGRIIAPAIVVLLIERDPGATTAFLKFQVQKNNEAERVFEAGVRFLGGEYYQQPEIFSDEMTAVFAAQSELAQMMPKGREVLFDFEQFSQAFRMFCKVRRLSPNDPAREASLWQARIFNPQIPSDAEVLGFRPDWKNASADPMPGEARR
jgi:hypothetical protein